MERQSIVYAGKGVTCSDAIEPDPDMFNRNLIKSSRVSHRCIYTCIYKKIQRTRFREEKKFSDPECRQLAKKEGDVKSETGMEEQAG